MKNVGLLVISSLWLFPERTQDTVGIERPIAAAAVAAAAAGSESKLEDKKSRKAVRKRCYF